MSVVPHIHVLQHRSLGNTLLITHISLSLFLRQSSKPTYRSFTTVFFFFLNFLRLCESVWVMHTTAHLWRSEGNFQDLVLPSTLLNQGLSCFCCCCPVHPRLDGPWVSGWFSYPDSHLTIGMVDYRQVPPHLVVYMGSGYQTQVLRHGQLSPLKVTPSLQHWFTLN